jgi:hypothetical protein
MNKSLSDTNPLFHLRVVSFVCMLTKEVPKRYFLIIYLIVSVLCRYLAFKSVHYRTVYFCDRTVKKDLRF